MNALSIKRISHITLLAIVASVFTTFNAVTEVDSAKAASALATCVAGSAAQNSIVVEPSHPTVMYIDSGVNPNVDAAYIGYRVSNRTGAILKGYWASFDNFSGGVVSLANPLDKFLSLPEIGINETKTVYVLVKASSSTKTAQAHDFKVWADYPGAASAVNKYGCNFAFSKVAETIKAAANKPTRTTVQAPGAIGTTFTVTSEGKTGTIGAGSADVGRILWFTPSAYSNFPTRAYRLESVVLKVGTKSNFQTNAGEQVRFYKERTFVKSNTLADPDSVFADEVLTADNLVGKRFYENTYTFRIIDAATASIVPMAQISSGTQIKHSVIAAAGTGSINSSTSALPANITKTLASTSYETFETPMISGTRYTAVPYKITLKGTTTTAITADRVVDNPASGAIYKTGSTLVKVGSGSAAAYSDPVTFTAEADISPRPIHFMGPFTFSSTSFVEITYTMYIPAVAGTYSNSASAWIGDRRITSSTAASIPAVNVIVNETGTVTTSETSTVKLLPNPLTKLASSIDTSTATLNGTINANDTTTAGYFEWGTSATLSTYTSESLGEITGNTASAKTKNLTGLTPATVYYFRIVAVAFGIRYEGTILNFRTLDQKATPTITTDAPTNVSLADATLNATVDPNLTEVELAFKIWRTNDTATVWVLDDPSIVEDTRNPDTNEDYNPKSRFAGASSTSVSIKMTDVATNLSSWITGGATIYYQAVILTTTGATTITASETKQFTFAAYSDQTITFDPITDITWGDSAPNESATATSELTVTFTSQTTDVCTIDGSGTITILKAGICTIAANQPGGLKTAGNYFNPAPEVIRSFTINPKPITVTADAKSKVYGEADPVLTYQITSGAMVGSEALTGELSRTSGENFGTYTINRNTLVASDNYVVTYQSANLSITRKPLTIKAESKTKASGESTPTFTYTISGLVSPDSVTSVTLTFPDASVAPTAPSSDGNYVITPSAAVFETGTATNYTITYETGTYTVTSLASQVLTWTTISTKTYGDTATATVTSNRGLDVTVTSLTTSICTVPNASVSGATVTILGAGTCQLNAAQAGNGTYAAATDVTTSFAVDPKGLTITATISATPKTYGDASATSGFTNSALVGSDAISGVTKTFTSGTPSYNSTAVPTLAGTFTLTPSSPVFSSGSASNYTISYVTTTYVIETKALTITASSHSVTEGDAVPTITPSYSTFAYSESAANLIGTITCSTVYTTSSAAGSYATSCSGYTSDNYTITYTAGSVTVSSGGAGTYTITYNLNGGTGTTPTESSKTNGQTFTTPSNGGFSRSGYSFSGWSCNSVTTAINTVVTVGTSNITCSAIWTIIGNSSPRPSSNEPTKSKKNGSARLVTVATTPVKSAISTAPVAPEPVEPSRPTPTTPTPTPTTPTPTRETLSETTVIPTTNTKPISFKGVGVAKVAVVGDEVSIEAKRGFSGKTTVLITVENDTEISQIVANVTVLPLPVSKLVVKEITEDRTRISWVRSPNATGYEVTQNGEVLCTTKVASCNLNRSVSEESPVRVQALGKDETKSEPLEAMVVAIKTVPEVALVVNFDTAKFNIDARDRALIQQFARDVEKFGYKEIDISGHTDSRGGIDNNILSNNRAKAARSYLLQLLPSLKVTINGFADVDSVAPNKTKEGRAANRRAEFRVVE